MICVHIEGDPPEISLTEQSLKSFTCFSSGFLIAVQKDISVEAETNVCSVTSPKGGLC